MTGFLQGNILHIHILGICGTFMASLAGIAKEKGIKVTGQDKAYYPPMSNQLQDLNIKENLTEDITDDLKNCDSVIIGNSLSRGDKSVEYVLKNNLSFFSGPEWIRNNILQDKFVFVVAGTHGKTTTTAMLIEILNGCGFNPSYLVGGILKNENKGYRYTDSDYFIIEGDEYDTSFFDKRSKFIHYKPNVLIINNIEYDHSDIFEDIEQIKKQFHFLIRSMPSNANIICNPKDINTKSLLEMGCWSNKINFYPIKNIKNIIGDHNIQNAAAAAAAAKIIGVKETQAAAALENFSGVKRRLEKKQHKNLIIYDDFAHHPTEIEASIKAIEEKHPEAKIVKIIEIRSNSMINGAHKNALIDIFKKTENLYIYCRKELNWLENTPYFDINIEIDDLVKKINCNTENVDIVILMSNGDTADVINKIINYGK